MKEERRYYTPQIEEFHVGFEYEFKDHLKGKWVPHKLGEISYFMWDDMNKVFDAFSYEDSLEDYFRVKYLDRSDVEELGFKAISDNDQFESTDDNYLSLEYFEEGKGWYLTYSENESQFGFGGWIKNKSELKKLMKQLNITI